MTLEVQVAARPELLIDRLVDRLAPPADDPFVTDLVVVPNAGMREWAATRLMDRLDVLAGVEFVFPAELTRRTLGLPDAADDPWRPERMAWHVLALLAEGADLGATPFAGVPARPWTVARRVADLLERAAAQRPDLVAAWLAGDDGGLGPARAWQATTWRALRGRIGVPSPAERLLAAADPSGGSSAGAGASALPDRLTVLGLSALTAPAAAVLATAARTSDVLVLATTASPAAVREALAAAGPDAGGGAQRGVGRPLHVAPARPDDVRADVHPLLAAWGRPALEAATLLARLPAAPTVLDVAETPTTQLARLQAGVFAADPAPAGAPARPDRTGDGDGSVQVHACHGLVRQLEVLRDVLLHALDADPTLRPRDIAVLCTDLAAVAPLAGPVLGADVDGRSLPVLVTDRAAGTAPPVEAALDAALALATSRLERDEVLTFLSLPVVTTALGLEADDLAVLERVAEQLAVRWGRDAAHRERWGYPPDVTVGTWREALDRLLAGLLLDGRDGPVDGLAPAAGFGMQDLGRIGRLADALDAVARLADLAAAPRPMADWAGPLRWIVDRLLRPERRGDAAGLAFAQQAAAVREVVDTLVADAAAAGDMPLDVREVRAALTDRLGGGGSRARLRTGHVSVASLAPLRGVPFRVVAVVDVGDTSGAGSDDDDVLALTPRLGERDAASEGRAALLDAVLAARDTLVVTCDGQDVRTGAALDLPTVVEELLDALPAAEDGAERAAAPLVVRHPRHLADRRNVSVGSGATGRVDPTRPFTFAPAALRALDAFAAAAGSARRPAAGHGVLTEDVGDGRWRTVPLPPAAAHHAGTASGADDGAVVALTLDDVVEALRRPARTLLRERLGVRLPHELTADPRTVELWVDDPLARWALGQDLLDHLVTGGDPARWVTDRPAAGGLPPGRIGRALLAGFVDEVVALHEAAGRPDGASVPVGVDLTLDGAVHGVTRVRLVGAVPHTAGAVVDVRYASDHASHTVAAAVALLAAATVGTTVPGPDGTAVPGTAHVVRRAPSGARDDTPVVRTLRLAGDDAARPAVARAALGALVDLALRVRSGPAPLLPRAAFTLDATADVTLPPSGTLRGDVARDLDDAAVGVVLGVSTLADLAGQVDGPLEVGLPDAPTPVQRWAAALRAPLTDPFVPGGGDADAAEEAA